MINIKNNAKIMTLSNCIAYLRKRSIKISPRSKMLMIKHLVNKVEDNRFSAWVKISKKIHQFFCSVQQKKKKKKRQKESF